MVQGPPFVVDFVDWLGFRDLVVLCLGDYCSCCRFFLVDVYFVYTLGCSFFFFFLCVSFFNQFIPC